MTTRLPTIEHRGPLEGARFNTFISDWEPAPARLPSGVCAWAIGDVHGHLGHFEALLAAIETLVAAAPAGPKHLVVLGDTIDRGPANIAALRRAVTLDLSGVKTTALWGNHEEYLDRFLNDETAGEDFLRFWADNGGLTTMADLGVSPERVTRGDAESVIAYGRAAAPASVRDSLARLKLGLRLGDYLFVHAGVHPRHGLEDTDIQRLTTMREPFLTGEHWLHDFAVVHGHSIIGPDILPHRISVDSGAYHTGVLTCVELRDDRARFLCVTSDDNLEALLKIRKRRPLSNETWRRFEP